MTDAPKKGDLFYCCECGMVILVTVDCKCDDPKYVCFECCGKEMDLGDQTA